MSNFRSKSFGVLCLMDERALRSLLDLQSEEELQLTHHAHLELPGVGITGVSDPRGGGGE